MFPELGFFDTKNNSQINLNQYLLCICRVPLSLSLLSSSLSSLSLWSEIPFSSPQLFPHVLFFCFGLSFGFYSQKINSVSSFNLFRIGFFFLFEFFVFISGFLFSWWIWTGLELGVMLGEFLTRRILGNLGMFPQVCFIFWDSTFYFS